MYTVSGDLLLLALKTYRAGDKIDSAKLFAAAALSSDVRKLEGQLIALSSEGFDELAASRQQFVLAEDEDFQPVEIDPDDVKRLVKKYRSLSEDGHRDESLEMVGNGDEIEVDDEELPDSEIEDTNNADEDEDADNSLEVSTDKEEAGQVMKLAVLGALSLMKKAIQSEKVRKLVPIILQAFPDLFLDEFGHFRKDIQIDDRRRQAIITMLQNAVRTMDNAEVNRLYTLTKNVDGSWA